MKNEITNQEKEKIYKNLLDEYGLSDVEDIVVVSENSEKLEERLRYIAKINILWFLPNGLKCPLFKNSTE